MKIKLSLSALYGLLSINLLAATEELTILYTNDLHSHLEPHLESWISESRPVGGFANLATMVKQEKAKKENTIYLGCRGLLLRTLRELSNKRRGSNRINESFGP